MDFALITYSAIKQNKTKSNLILNYKLFIFSKGSSTIPYKTDEEKYDIKFIEKINSLLNSIMKKQFF